MDFSLLKIQFDISRRDGHELTKEEKDFAEYVSNHMEDFILKMAREFGVGVASSHSYRCTCSKTMINDSCPIHGVDSYPLMGKVN